MPDDEVQAAELAAKAQANTEGPPSSKQIRLALPPPRPHSLLLLRLFVSDLVACPAGFRRQCERLPSPSDALTLGRWRRGARQRIFVRRCRPHSEQKIPSAQTSKRGQCFMETSSERTTHLSIARQCVSREGQQGLSQRRPVVPCRLRVASKAVLSARRFMAFTALCRSRSSRLMGIACLSITAVIGGSWAEQNERMDGQQAPSPRAVGGAGFDCHDRRPVKIAKKNAARSASLIRENDSNQRHSSSPSRRLRPAPSLSLSLSLSINQTTLRCEPATWWS